MNNIITQQTTQSRIYRRRWWMLAVVSVTVLLATIDETILNVAIPSLQRDLGASASSLLWMVNSYMLVFGGLLLTMGGVGDRFGRARMLRYGLAVFALSSLGAALAQSPAQLIGARAIMGMGGAMMMPATLAVIANVFEEKERPNSDRDMGDDGRNRRRAWTHPGRGAAQVLLLGVGVPGERADCRDRDCGKPIPRAG